MKLENTKMHKKRHTISIKNETTSKHERFNNEHNIYEIKNTKHN